MRIRRILSLGFILFFIFCAPGLAHKVNLFCYWEDGRLYGEGYFSKGHPVQHGEITIYDTMQQSLIRQAVTDEDGKFVLDMKVMPAVRVVLKSGQGHQAEFELGPEEEAPSGAGEKYGGASGGQDTEKLITRKIKPLEARIRALEQQRAERGLMTAVGGVGWIAGIFTLIYFIKKKNAS